jgi:hypothetical protein
LEIASSIALFNNPNLFEGNQPLHAHHFPKYIQSKFEMTILFSVVESFSNYVFGDENPPQGNGFKLY